MKVRAEARDMRARGLVGMTSPLRGEGHAFESHRAHLVIPKGTVEFFSEIAIPLNFTAEHAKNAEAPKNPSKGWNRLKTLRTRRSPR